MHEVEVILHVKIGIPEDKRATVGNITTSIEDLGIEPKIAEQRVQPHKDTKSAMKNNGYSIGEANSSVCSLPFIHHF